MTDKINHLLFINFDEHASNSQNSPTENSEVLGSEGRKKRVMGFKDRFEVKSIGKGLFQEGVEE